MNKNIVCDNYDLITLEKIALKYHICLYPSENNITTLYDTFNHKSYKGFIKGKQIRKNSLLYRAIMFYKVYLKPCIAQGSNTFKLSNEGIVDFCSKLTTKKGVVFVISLCLSKSLSDRRTGSPNSLLDFAVLEMLSNLSTLVLTANRSSLTLKFILLDEASVFEPNNILGITKSDNLLNHQIINKYLTKLGSDKYIVIKNITDSIMHILGKSYNHLLKVKYNKLVREVKTELKLQLSNNYSKVLLESLVMFDVIPNRVLISMKYTNKGINHMRKQALTVNGFSNLPENIMALSISQAARLEAVLSLRMNAFEAFNNIKRNKSFTEFNLNVITKAGMTRSKERWSFLPHPIRFKGKTIFPLHGIAIYSKNGKYLGNISFKEAKNMPNTKIIYYNNYKPLFAIINI